MCDRKLERAPIGIRWTDLQPMNRADTLRELLLPLPWLAASLAIYATPTWPLGFLAAFMFFLCALRLNHEAIHGNLGLPRRGDHAVLHGLSFLMLGSNHAVAHGHMLHHRHAMGPEDFEGRCGHMSFGIAIAQCLTALFAVWITHRGASERGVVARSQRGILARAAYLMFYHREHHLFPRVPVHRLPILAERLDRGVPGYAAARLPVVPFLEPKEA